MAPTDLIATRLKVCGDLVFVLNGGSAGRRNIRLYQEAGNVYTWTSPFTFGGPSGPEDHVLANPQDLICNNATQEVHVLDDAEIVYGRTNPRIVVFSFNGTYLRSFNLSSSFSSVTSIGRSQLSGNFFVGTLQSKLLTYDATGAMIGVTNLTSVG